jgi:hypothetical protein
MAREVGAHSWDFENAFRNSHANRSSGYRVILAKLTDHQRPGTRYARIVTCDINQTSFEAAEAHPSKAIGNGRHERLFFFVLPVLLLAFAPQVAAKKKADIVYDKNIDFSRYRTYAWVQGFPVVDPTMNQYVIHSVDDVLRRSGLTETKVSEADLVVTYNAARDSDLSVGTALDPTFAATGGIPLSGQSIWQTSSTGGGSTHVRKGSLNFEILDRMANKTIWSGTAKNTISDKPGDQWSQIQKALDDLFHDYPPTTTKRSNR